MTFIFPSAQLTSAPTPPGSLSNFSYLEKRKKPMVILELEVRSTHALRQIFVTFVTCLNFASLIIYLKICFHPNQNFQKKSHCVAPRFRYHCIGTYLILLTFFYVRTYMFCFVLSASCAYLIIGKLCDSPVF